MHSMVICLPEDLNIITGIYHVVYHVVLMLRSFYFYIRIKIVCSLISLKVTSFYKLSSRAKIQPLNFIGFCRVMNYYDSSVTRIIQMYGLGK